MNRKALDQWGDWYETRGGYPTPETISLESWKAACAWMESETVAPLRAELEAAQKRIVDLEREETTLNNALVDAEDLIRELQERG
jgi:predicted  nucleic acid-binding Zn-ribbon protein